MPRSDRQLVDRPPLSPRERQILAIVVLNCSNAEIARKLGVTESNVKSHVTSAFSKLEVKSRGELYPRPRERLEAGDSADLSR